MGSRIHFSNLKSVDATPYLLRLNSVLRCDVYFFPGIPVTPCRSLPLHLMTFSAGEGRILRHSTAG